MSLLTRSFAVCITLFMIESFAENVKSTAKSASELLAILRFWVDILDIGDDGLTFLSLSVRGDYPLLEL